MSAVVNVKTFMVTPFLPRRAGSPFLSDESASAAQQKSSWNIKQPNNQNRLLESKEYI